MSFYVILVWSRVCIIEVKYVLLWNVLEGSGCWYKAKRNGK